MFYYIKKIIESIFKNQETIVKNNEEIISITKRMTIYRQKHDVINDTIKNNKLKNEFILFLKENNIELSVFQSRKEKVSIMIIILFYFNLIILHDDWYLIWINEKFDINIFKNNKTFQIDPIFFECVMKNTDNKTIEDVKSLEKIQKEVKRREEIMNFTQKNNINSDNICNFIYFPKIKNTDDLKKNIILIINIINKQQNDGEINFSISDQNIFLLFDKYKIKIKKGKYKNYHIYVIILLYLYLSLSENRSYVYYFIIIIQKIFIYKKIFIYNKTGNNLCINKQEIILNSLDSLIIILAIMNYKNKSKEINFKNSSKKINTNIKIFYKNMDCLVLHLYLYIIIYLRN